MGQFLALKIVHNLRLKNLLAALATIIAVSTIAGCADDASVASHNLSKAADMFQLSRRVVFYNGITDSYMLTIEGRCSVEADGMDKQLEVTCRIGDASYKKHFLGLSDNVTYFVEQLEPKAASVYHYKVIFKPQSIVPDIDLKSSLGG